MKKTMEDMEDKERIEKVTRDERLRGKEAILAILERAADDKQFLAQLADNPAQALSLYYTLTPEEMTALVTGDIRQIESWIGKLDKRQATWLWARLSQEKW